MLPEVEGRIVEADEPSPRAFDVAAAQEGSRKAESEERNRLRCEAVIDIAAALFSVPAEALLRNGRTTRRIARVRQIAMYAAHTLLGISQKEVGRAFGRDRTTVVHACHTVEDLRDDRDFEHTVMLFETILLAAFRLLLEEPAR